MLYMDIETSSLNPRNGVVFCVGFLDDDSGKVIGDDGSPERSILIRTARMVKLADTIVTFSGSRFDIPFLNYRLAVHRLPKIKPRNHIDVQKMLPHQSNGHPASLEKSAKARGIDAKDTPYSDELWDRARAGDRQALADIGQHCREDVITLRELHRSILNAYVHGY